LRNLAAEINDEKAFMRCLDHASPHKTPTDQTQASTAEIHAAETTFQRSPSMIPQLTIRRAIPSDAKAIADLMRSAYAQYSDTILDMPDVSSGIEADITDNLTFVALANDRVMAAMILIEHPDHLMLANIATAPDARGLGLGKTLLSAAEHETLARGHSQMRLTTHIDMPGNLTLYAHLGWEETHRDGHKVHMAKSF
jgi:ribosomal protein S18 acetylase RimI-like enzyme